MTIVTIGLIAVLFSIGLVVFWYVLLFAIIFWGVRRLYYFFKGKQPPTFREQFYYYNSRYTQTPESKTKKHGRVIDYDEFKDK